MVQEKLPKKLLKTQGEKPYIMYLGSLTETMDGNSIIIVFNEIENILLKHNVENKMKTVEVLIRLISEYGYHLRKIEKYVEKQILEIEKNEAFYQQFCECWNHEYSCDFTKQTGIQEINFSNIIFLLLRYNTGQKKLGNYSLLGTYPPDISRAISRMNNEILDREASHEDFVKITKILTEKYQFEDIFNGETYFSIVPQSEFEMTREGNNMHNCLVMRHRDVASNNMHIVFLQKERGKSYIDIIMNNEDKIIFAITDFHENVKGKDKNLVFDWYKKHVKEVNSFKEIFC